jgi:putative FmdB family regulatory protein
MPLYLFECSCGNKFDILTGYTNKEPPVRRKCPKCKKLANRVFGNINVKFIGSGFYENDYKGKR